MKISVITACYQCVNSIVQTVQSVLTQEKADFEYIIIDGNSSDGTSKYVREIESQYDNVTVVSEPDDGTYDAMNKGVRIATGDYVFFLNSGDVFYDSKVLSNVSGRLKTYSDLYYGCVCWGGQEIKTFPRRINLFWLIFREKMICHQAIIAKRDMLLMFPFDISLKICADRDWLIKCVLHNCTIESIQPLVISVYDIHGASSHHALFSKDSIIIANKYGGKIATLFIRIKRLCGFFLGRRYTK